MLVTGELCADSVCCFSVTKSGSNFTDQGREESAIGYRGNSCSSNQHGACNWKAGSLEGLGLADETLMKRMRKHTRLNVHDHVMNIHLPVDEHANSISISW